MHYSTKLNFSKIAVAFLFLCFAQNAYSEEKDSIAVYVFMSETCPICKSVTLELKSLHSTYSQMGVEFICVFPNVTMSTEASINKFARKYKIPFTLVLDEGGRLTNRFSATITPQVFAIRKSDNTLLYSGKIDNSFEAIGKRRAVVTERYLNSALHAVVNQESVNPSYTAAVGCYIVSNSHEVKD